MLFCLFGLLVWLLFVGVVCSALVVCGVLGLLFLWFWVWFFCVLLICGCYFVMFVLVFGLGWVCLAFCFMLVSEIWFY